MANAPTPQHKDQPKHDERGDDKHQHDRSEADKQASIQQSNERDRQDPNLPAALQGTTDENQKQRAEDARKLVDDYEKDGDEDMPLTTQTDQVRRSMDMETVGPTAWMNETEARIQERSDERRTDEPRQLHGVAQAQKPR